MAVISQQRVTFLFNVRVFLLWIYISSIWFAGSQGIFKVRNYEENEVVFEGEQIVLECRAPSDVSNPQFTLLNSQNNVLVDHRYQSFADGRISYPIEGGVNFQIVITSALIQKTYFCQISEDDNVLTIEEISLNVTPRVSPQCYVNTSTTVTTGDVVGLSCYQEVSALSSNFILRQILRNGTVNEELPLEYSGLINSFKRKLSSYIRATATDDGSEFECVIIDSASGSEKTCTTGEISVQQNQEVTLTITPSRLYSLDRGQSVLFTCESSDARYMPSWERNNIYQQTDANVVYFGNVLSVTIPSDTGLTNGQVLTSVCRATFEGHSEFDILGVIIAFASNSNSTTTASATTLTTTMQPPQVMLTFSPATVPPLDRGYVVEVQCSPSLPDYEVFWIIVGAFDDHDAQIAIGGGLLRITIPINTSLPSGTVLNFACVAPFNAALVSRPLSVLIQTNSITHAPTTNEKDLQNPNRDENSSSLLPLITACSVTFVFIVIVIVTALFCRKKIWSLFHKGTGMETKGSDSEATKSYLYSRDQKFHSDKQISKVSDVTSDGSGSEATNIDRYDRRIIVEGYDHVGQRGRSEEETQSEANTSHLYVKHTSQDYYEMPVIGNIRVTNERLYINN